MPERRPRPGLAAEGVRRLLGVRVWDVRRGL